MNGRDKDTGLGQIRLATVVLIVAFVGWMFLSFLGGRLGWDIRYAFLFDFAALGAIAWSMIVVFNVWRKRRAERED